MGFRVNVTALCAKMGIESPILEEDIDVGELVFVMADGTRLEEKRNDSEANRAGRLLVEYHATLWEWFLGEKVTIGYANQILVSDHFKEVAHDYFEDAIWNNCSPTCDPLVYGIKNCFKIEIYWKHSMV